MGPKIFKYLKYLNKIFFKFIAIVVWFTFQHWAVKCKKGLRTGSGNSGNIEAQKFHLPNKGKEILGTDQLMVFHYRFT